MKTLWIAPALVVVALPLYGCADWFEPDTCGGPVGRLEVTPPTACLDNNLTVTIADDGSHRIEGTNGCSDALSVTLPDGTVSNFAARAAVTILLQESAASRDASGREQWVLSAKLGTNSVTLTATVSPC